jgi:selenocysteine-specific elongation factor
VLAYLTDQGKIVRVSPEVAFSQKAYSEMTRAVVERAKADGKITVGQVRDMFGTSRKYALAMMEYLDQQRITRRIGDEHILRQQ